jgi:hypothetical protein
MALLTSQASFLAFFSEGQISSPVSATPLGECNAITSRCRREDDLTLLACPWSRLPIVAADRFVEEHFSERSSSRGARIGVTWWCAGQIRKG